MKQKSLLLILLLIALGSLSASNWTVLVYMAADNNLANQGKLDINSMESVNQPAGLNIIVQADFPEGAKRYKIRKDSSPEISSSVLQNLGTIDSGNPQTLNNFIDWGFSSYPAEHTMLVIWSHGDSWYKGTDSKWICPDDGAENLMSIANGDLQIAFAGAPKLDILLFDACSMQGIEVIGEVATYADYVIGSELDVPVSGFPYESIIPLFDQDLSTILTQIPLLYVQSYLPETEANPGYQFWEITCSTIATAQVPQFMEFFGDFAQNHRASAAEIMQLRSDLYTMNTGLADVDISQFLTLISQMQGAIQQTGLQLLSLWNSMVISSQFTTSSWDSVEVLGTAALWFPGSRFNFNNGWPGYLKLNFAKTRWLSLVNAALGADSFAPDSPSLISQSMVLGSLLLQVNAPPDPDSLYYEMRIVMAEYPETRLFFPNPDASSFSISFPITASATYELVAIDQSGNRSQPLQGSYEYSKPVSSVIVYPNPVRGKGLAMVRWWTEEDSGDAIKLEMFNFKGQKVLSRDLQIPQTGEGSYLLSADAIFQDLAAGRYFLKLQIGREQFIKKLLILY